jgi:pyruvate/2-oxoglutarate/acetoin dehydrogenase E1 component
MDKKTTSVEIEKTGNGWIVTENYKTQADKHEWDFMEEKFVYTSLDEALAKIKELVG